MLPYDKDTHFVGRQDILSDIQDRLSDDSKHVRVAITGIGGVGSVTARNR